MGGTAVECSSREDFYLCVCGCVWLTVFVGTHDYIGVPRGVENVGLWDCSKELSGKYLSKMGMLCKKSMNNENSYVSAIFGLPPTCFYCSDTCSKCDLGRTKFQQLLAPTSLPGLCIKVSFFSGDHPPALPKF